MSVPLLVGKIKKENIFNIFIHVRTSYTRINVCFRKKIRRDISRLMKSCEKYENWIMSSHHISTLVDDSNTSHSHTHVRRETWITHSKFIDIRFVFDWVWKNFYLPLSNIVIFMNYCESNAKYSLMQRSKSSVIQFSLLFLHINTPKPQLYNQILCRTNFSVWNPIINLLRWCYNSTYLCFLCILF